MHKTEMSKEQQTKALNRLNFATWGDFFCVAQSVFEIAECRWRSLTARDFLAFYRWEGGTWAWLFRPNKLWLYTQVFVYTAVWPCCSLPMAAVWPWLQFDHGCCLTMAAVWPRLLFDHSCCLTFPAVWPWLLFDHGCYLIMAAVWPWLLLKYKSWSNK